MKLQTPTMVEGTWAKKGEDIFNNDIITILNEGTMRENTEYPDKNGNPKTELVFKIKTKKGDERILSFGYDAKTGYKHKSLESLSYSFGDDTANWVGREVKVFLTPTPTGKASTYLCHKDTQKVENPDGTVSFTRIKDNGTVKGVPLPTEDTRDYTNKDPDEEIVNINF